MTEEPAPYHIEGSVPVLRTIVVGTLRVDCLPDALRFRRAGKSFVITLAEFDAFADALNEDAGDDLEDEEGELLSAPSDFLAHP